MSVISREKLIISADDFGINEKANASILRLARLGKLDRVSVMMGGVLEESEILELLVLGVKLDAHLSLGNAEEWNRKNGKKKYGIIRSISFLIDYFFGKWGKREVLKNWEGQILEFRKVFGKNPDGLNSHEHLHFFLPYFRIFLSLAKKYEIEYIRFGSLGISKAGKNGGLAKFILKLLWKIDWKIFYAKKFSSSDFVLSFDWLKNPEEFKKSLFFDKKTEMVFHPEREEENGFILENL